MGFKYKIAVEDDVLVVIRVADGGTYAYYFATSSDTSYGDAQEMYNMLNGAGLDVEVVDEHH